MLQLLQFLGNIPLRVDGGLLAHPVLGHQPGLGFGHLYVIAKDLVGGNFHIFDAGLLLGPHLHRHNVAAGVGEQVPQLVHLGVVAGADKVPLPDGEGQGLFAVVPNGPVQQVPQLGQVVQLRAQGLEQG